tara:strand:+ start:51 stop:692 length:642 start_codon:yes stop_codon:yes gene_type:complete
MAKRGRPKGSLNKKTLEKLEQSSNGIKETDLSTTQKKVLDGPDIVAPQSETKGKIEVKTRTVADLPRTPSIIEILTLVEETKGDDAKVDILKQFTDRNDVKYALKAAFDSRVVFTLPDGLPDGFVIGDPDTPEGAMDMAPERFIRVYKRMQYWVEGGRAQAKQSKKEEIFLDTLRSLEKSEAEFLLAIKNKTMPYKSVTKEICEKAGFDLSPK